MVVEQATSVIALAIAFGFAFLGVLQWAYGLIKTNDKERRELHEENIKVRNFANDLQNQYNALKNDHADLVNKYSRLASGAKRLRDENDMYRGNLLRTDDIPLTASEVLAIETDIGLGLAVDIDIDNAH